MDSHSDDGSSIEIWDGREKISTTFVLIVFFGGESIRGKKKDVAPVKMSKVGLSSINLI